MENLDRGRDRARAARHILVAKVIVTADLSRTCGIVCAAGYCALNAISMPPPKTILFWVFILLMAVVLWRMSPRVVTPDAQHPTYSEFMSQVDQNNIREVTIYPSATSYDVEGEWREPDNKFRVTIIRESASDLIKALRDRGVPINVQERTRPDWINFLLTAAPLFLLVGFWIVMMRQMQTKGKNQ